MKWLVVSDLHYGLRQYDWVCEVAADFDLVVIAGDLLDLRSVVPIEAQGVAVTAQVGGSVPAAGSPRARATTISIAATAWQTAAEPVPARGEQVLVDGDTAVVGDTLVSVCGWWDGPGGRADLDARFEAEALSRTAARWAWVYHAPPTGSPLTWTAWACVR